jgi:hypothetical protein
MNTRHLQAESVFQTLFEKTCQDRATAAAELAA